MYHYCCIYTAVNLPTKLSPPLPLRSLNIITEGISLTEIHMCTGTRHAGVRRRRVNINDKVLEEIYIKTNPQKFHYRTVTTQPPSLSTEQNRHSKLNIVENCVTAVARTLTIVHTTYILTCHVSVFFQVWCKDLHQFIKRLLGHSVITQEGLAVL